MMPEDGIEQLRAFDAVYLGAAGFPTVPDHISLWGLLIPIRREFDQHINLRPVRLFDGVPCPLAGREPGDIDFYVVRENVEGEYSAIGGIGTEASGRGSSELTRTGSVGAGPSGDCAPSRIHCRITSMSNCAKAGAFNGICAPTDALPSSF